SDLGSFTQEILDEQSWPEEIALELNLTAGLVVAVDPERLRRAFINVFSNAVQSFTGEKRGDEKLSITLLPAGKRVQLVVMDNGSGISDEVMPRIFEPMFSTKNFGVGLGMAIVKNIMEEQGGGVEIVSQPGRGTSVTLCLPRYYNVSGSD
ncbi:MAG: ATP-binding protein, partial [Desulfuromonadales bacterium]|nr:ATP-binding protein [Desulfuromonadales bacterium]